MSNRNTCPKCGKKLSPLYMKQNCPSCNVNLLYYHMDEKLENDAKKAKAETDAVKRFLLILKESSIGSVWHIIRLVLFFTPLASMCLPMYWAGHKNVSLITFIMNIVNHGFDIASWSTDYLCAMLSIIMIVVLSLAVIINSLFSATKKGFRRNIIFSMVNTTVFGGLASYCCVSGGVVKIGFYVTMLILALELILHYAVAKPKTVNKKKALAVALVWCLVCTNASVIPNDAGDDTARFMSNYDADIRVVSFNVASAFGTSFEDTDSMVRCQRFIDYMNDVKPNMIGTQELNSYWLNYIDENMQGYTIYGVKRGGDSEEKNSEMNAIIWQSDMFDEVEKGTFWLSDTPDEESKFSVILDDGTPIEAGCNRICTYAVLKNNDKLLLFMNTHLDNSSEQARIFGASVIMQKMADLRMKYDDDIAVVLTGDFNEYENNEACEYISGILNDTTNQQVKKSTYQEWGYSRGDEDEPIDFIYTTEESLEYQVLDDLSQGYISDHYGIYSAINL